MLTSGFVSEDAGQLLAVATRLRDEAEQFGGAITAWSTDVDTLRGGWEGPLPRAIDGAAEAYFDAVSPVAGAFESLADTTTAGPGSPSSLLRTWRRLRAIRHGLTTAVSTIQV